MIPSFNPGEIVFATVSAARSAWDPVWVVVDGSDDGTAERLQEIAEQDPGLRIFRLRQNCGKGAAIYFALDIAIDEGYTHALIMDSDGQHPAHLIDKFMQVSRQHPYAMILGKPVFDTDAPALRVQGRKVSNFWANLETLGWGIGDSLYGFRVYPIAELRAVMQRQRWMRRFDFDPEAAVRLAWRGVTAVNLPAPVKYLHAGFRWRFALPLFFAIIPC